MFTLLALDFYAINMTITHVVDFSCALVDYGAIEI